MSGVETARQPKVRCRKKEELLCGCGEKGEFDHNTSSLLSLTSRIKNAGESKHMEKESLKIKRRKEKRRS